MMKLRGKWLVLILCLSLCLPLVVPTVALAGIPFETMSKDSYERYFFTQSAYTPVSLLAHNLFIVEETDDPENPGKIVPITLNNPQDLFITPDDHIYIADTGNHRIVHLDPDGELVRLIMLEEKNFRQPEGLFIDQRGYIYVADTGNKRVVILNPQGQFVREFLQPESTFIPDAYQFDPFNLVVDNRGFMYVASRGSYQGLLLMSPDGQFQGFFGANPTEATIFDRIKMVIYTEEQLSRQVRLLPRVIRGLDIDSTGFIYTTTFGTRTEQIKKLNIRSENQFEAIQFGEHRAFPGTRRDASQLVDITIDTNGNVFAIDRGLNAVYIYNTEGELLFLWSGNIVSGQTQLGMIHSPSSIATNSNNELFILDSHQNNIHKMRPSEFGDLVFGAISLMEDGRYADSVDSFREIIRLNSNFSLAYRGIGLAAYYSDNYEEAMRMFELAGDKVGFSDAFWQIRLEFFQRHFAMLANILVALGVIAIIGGRLKKKYNISFKIRLFKREYLLIEQLKHALFILRRPIEGFTDIRYESKGSYLSACILVLAAIIVLLFKTFYTHFPFTGNQPVHELKVGVIILQFVVVWLSWVICNYLISSIYQGEGRFKDVFVGSTYAFTPLILFGIPVVIMSNGMSLSEVSIYNFFDLFIILWILALVFWKVQALQNYSVGETIINILLTMFAMIILWVLIFIVLGLSSEFFEFLYSLYQEVTMR